MRGDFHNKLSFAHFYVLLLLAMFMGLPACKRDKFQPDKKELVGEAKKWFDDQGSVAYSPSWDEAQTVHLNHQDFVVVPSNISVSSGGLPAPSYLVVALSEKGYRGNIIDFFNVEAAFSESSIAEAISNYLVNGTKAEFAVGTDFHILLFDLQHHFLEGSAVVGGKPAAPISSVKPSSLEIKKLMGGAGGGGHAKEKPPCDDYYYILRDRKTGEMISAMYLYTLCSGGGGGNNTGSGGGGSNSKGKRDVNNEFKDYPCAKALVEQMKTLNGDIATLIKDTFGKNDNVNINFFAEPSLTGKTVDGKTDGPNIAAGNYYYNVGINPDILKNSTKEYMLATFYHEALHAYFAEQKRILKNQPGEFERRFLGIEVNGGRLLKVQDVVHWPMGYDKFIRGIKDAILAFNPNFDVDRALAIAKTGIVILTPAEDKVNNQERDATNNSGATGTKCPK